MFSSLSLNEHEHNKNTHSNFQYIPPKESDNFSKLKQEFLLFRNSGKRTSNLEDLFKAVSTVKPTSTSNERTFSVCTNFCTKIRSRLADKSLMALVFLKYYYIRAKKINEVKKVQ